MVRRTLHALLGAAVLAVSAPVAHAGSLYDGPAPRPGPDILYRDPATAPQLTNSGTWDARPILISGASAYRDGEFLYQDFLYDDHGARLSRDPNDPRENNSFSEPNGTYTYPTASPYAGNAADLVELRVEPLASATAFRVTLNTMKDPARVAFTIAIGGSPSPRAFPHGANVEAPAELFLTVHGSHVELRRAGTGVLVRPAPEVAIDRVRRQFDVRVPRDAWNPRRETVRLAAGVGLWDRTNGTYLLPQASSDAAHPGGGGGPVSRPAAFFNVAFRYDEPWPDLAELGGIGTVSNPSWWRDKHQGAALARNSIAPFFARVDFSRLEAGVRDDMAGERGGVPETGPMNRILASHFDGGQGIDFTSGCGANNCLGELRGALQPYAIYVPDGPPPADGYGLTLLLHSLDAGYNQYSASRHQRQLGERGANSIVITPAGRGPDGWYYGRTGADTFEVWADVARRYDLDPRWTSIAGYSMGGYGTYKFAAQYPDLFARANPIVGPPAQGIWTPPFDPQPNGQATNTNRMLASVRHIPFLIWVGALDELVPIGGPTAQAATFDDLGYRYIYDVFTADHLALAANDQYAPAARFLGGHEVDRNPARVTYVVNPTMDFASAGTVADHAYWLSGMRLRDETADAPLGHIDARSLAFGEGSPRPLETQHDAGTLGGGNYPTGMAYVEQSRWWGPVPAREPADVLRLAAENIAAVRVHVERARLSCRPRLDVTSDGPLEVTLVGCGRTLTFD